MEINTFDILMIDFGEVEFAGEQGGIRPAVVIQNAYGNIYSDILNKLSTTTTIMFSTLSENLICTSREAIKICIP